MYRFENRVEQVPRQENNFNAVVDRIEEDTGKREMVSHLSGFQTRNAAQFWADAKVLELQKKLPQPAQMPETD